MSIVKLGLYIMLACLVSMAVSIPLGYGYVSGVGFASGMVISWIGGIIVIAGWILKRIANGGRR